MYVVLKEAIVGKTREKCLYVCMHGYVGMYVSLYVCIAVCGYVCMCVFVFLQFHACVCR